MIILSTILLLYQKKSGQVKIANWNPGTRAGITFLNVLHMVILKTNNCGLIRPHLSCFEA